MTKAELILYAGYGTNRDPAMVESITGQRPKTIGQVAIVGFELCVQTIDQTPVLPLPGALQGLSVQQILKSEASWGQDSDFETYTIRPLTGGNVDARLYELTKEERALIAEWEMIELGWFQAMQVETVDELGAHRIAVTEGLGIGQEVDRVVNGGRYATYLNDKQKMHDLANNVRREYLRRLAKSPNKPS